MVVLLMAYLLVQISCINASEFLYPLALCKDDTGHEFVLVMHQQTTVPQLEIWAWDALTGQAAKLLPSYFTPTGVSVVPDGTGFSFIDNDVIRIKLFKKRSVIRVETFSPLSHISPISWTPAQEKGYFHARQAGNSTYGIFSVTTKGDCVACVQDRRFDALYPSCPDATCIFYIQRSFSENKPSYAVVAQSLTHTESVQEIYQQTEPLIFLTMVNSTQGFVIAHPACLDQKTLYIPFKYYELRQRHDGSWKHSERFSFSLPTNLLQATFGIVQESAYPFLYESILPLLPRITTTILYYVSVDPVNGKVLPYAYSMADEQVTQLATEQALYFTPFPWQSSLFYGGPCTSQSFVDNDKGQVCFFLLKSSLNF